MSNPNLAPLGIPGDEQYVSYGKLQPPKNKKIDQKEWERKQRLREYRVAARREKRNRKSDEKKQRKLNATILRRMTRNPDKYNKNAGRNRERKIMAERRRIHTNAIKAVQRLAGAYDPSGKMFNVAPVTTLEDGSLITVEALNRRKEGQARKEAAARGEAVKGEEEVNGIGAHNVKPERLQLLEQNGNGTEGGRQLSKTQIRKQAAYEPRPPTPKPILPEGIEFPSDEEENWLSLWDLADLDLERRTMREKRKAQKARKDLRIKQKSGKAERRAGRDEKRRVYRDIKQTWKTMREEERKRRKQLQVQEDEEGKRLAVRLTQHYRKQALEAAAELGFTLDNVEGVNDIKPKASGMKGVQVNFDELDIIGDKPGDIRPKNKVEREKPFPKNRVDLSAIADEAYAQNIFGAAGSESAPKDSLNSDFVSLSDVNGTNVTPIGQTALTYNHRVRRKLRRAVENTQVRKEILVRQKAIEYCQSQNIPIPPALETPTRPVNKRGSRLMPNGTLETAKQERVRARVELAEFNKWAKVLRRQAKEKSIESGMRVYLELMDRIPRRVTLDMDRKTGDQNGDEGVGEMMSAADIIASWPMPDLGEGRFGDVGEYEVDSEDEGGAEHFIPPKNSEFKKQKGAGDRGDEETSEDSASKQLRGEMKGVETRDVEESVGESSSSSDEDEDESGSEEGNKEVEAGESSSDDDDDDDGDEEMEDI